MPAALPLDPAECLRVTRSDRWKVSSPDAQGCVLWQGHTARKSGYGIVTVGGRQVTAHRVALVAALGRDIPGMVADHVRQRGCHSRACVNAQHLEPVSNDENIRRGEWRGSSRYRGTCKWGHPLTERPYCGVCQRMREYERRDLTAWAARVTGLSADDYAECYGQGVVAARRILGL